MSFYSWHKTFPSKQLKYICVHITSLLGVFLGAGYTRFAHSWPVQMSAHEQGKHVPTQVTAIVISCLGLLISRAINVWGISNPG